MHRLDIYFTFSSSFSYLAWHRVHRLFPERYANAQVRWVPVNFLRLNELQGLSAKPPVPHQLAYNAEDAGRWAKAYGIPYLSPTRRFGPTQDAVKGFLLAEGQRPHVQAAWMDAVFTAYRQEGKDLSDRSMLAHLAKQVGMSGFLEGMEDPALDHKLEENTQAALRNGAPGVPYAVIDGEQWGYWGNDRLAWMEARLAGKERPDVL